MAYSYNRGCKITFIRGDGRPVAGETKEYLMFANYKVTVQDEGFVEVMYFGKPSLTTLYPSWRIYKIEV